MLKTAISNQYFWRNKFMSLKIFKKYIPASYWLLGTEVHKKPKLHPYLAN